MASQLIAHVAAWYIPTGQPLVNDMDGLTIDGAYRLEAQRMHAELERRARGQPLCVEIDIRPVKNKRTLDQNRLMWALLNRLALALSGDTPGGVTAEQCYLDLLAEFGAEVETWRVPVKALPALRNTYRVVQMVEHEQVLWRGRLRQALRGVCAAGRGHGEGRHCGDGDPSGCPSPLRHADAQGKPHDPDGQRTAAVLSAGCTGHFGR